MTNFQSKLIEVLNTELNLDLELYQISNPRKKSPAVESYLQTVGTLPEYEWPMALIYWATKRTAEMLGVENPLNDAPAIVDEWNSGRNTHLTSPEPGAIFIMQLPSGVYHIGIITNEKNGADGIGRVYTIEGNPNSYGRREYTGVVCKWRLQSDMIGYIRLEDKPVVDNV